jgi:hypothetical protein
VAKKGRIVATIARIKSDAYGTFLDKRLETGLYLATCVHLRQFCEGLRKRRTETRISASYDYKPLIYILKEK